MRISALYPRKNRKEQYSYDQYEKKLFINNIFLTFIAWNIKKS